MLGYYQFFIDPMAWNVILYNYYRRERKNQTYCIAFYASRSGSDLHCLFPTTLTWPFSPTYRFLPCNRDPLLLVPPTLSLPHCPLVIGNPINRNLSNPPTQTTSISLETAPSTTNHAFTQTALIPRVLFFKIVTSLLFGGLRLTARIRWVYSAVNISAHLGIS